MKQTYRIQGMSCNGCKANVEKTLSQMDGVQEVYADLNLSEVSVSADRPLEMDQLQKAMVNAGLHYTLYAQEEDFREKEVKGAGNGIFYCPMHCEGEKVYPAPGDCPVCGMDLVEQPAEQESASYTCPMHPEVSSAVPGSCPICGMDLVLKVPEETAEQKNLRVLYGKMKVSLLFTLPIFVIAMSEMIPGNPLFDWMSPKYWNWLQFVLSLPVVFYATWMFFERAWRSIVSMKLNMFTLIGIGAGVAFLFSILALLAPGIFPEEFKSANGEVHVYFEAVTVILTLVLLGQLLEARAHGRTSKAIKELMGLAPSTAYRLLDSGEEEVISVKDIAVGDRLRIKPGDKIPVDGKVARGMSTIDESMITGEPVPVEKGLGELVHAGTINGSGSFEMLAEKVGSDTMLSKIISLVREASRSRSPMQNLADRVSRYFVPAVIAVSLLTFAIWWIFGPEPALVYGFVNAIAVLIIACPCALGLATPMSVMVAVGKGAQNGILIKNAASLEKLGEIDVLITDKTGTITEGRPVVEQLSLEEGIKEKEVLDLILSVNSRSEHPLARAMVSYARQQGADFLEVNEFNSMPGFGVSAKVLDRDVKIGNEALMLKDGIAFDALQNEKIIGLQVQGKAVSYLSIDGQLAGYVVLADPIKPSSAKALEYLKREGVEVFMATGDHENAAAKVADSVGITEFKGRCSPVDKLNWIKELQASGKKVGMAGDGINDAPALAQADVGIAMGSGTDIAMDSAGITLVKGDLQGIYKARKLSKGMLANIRQNLFFAFLYNSIGIPIAAGVLFPVFGILLSPMIAAAAMSFSSVSVIVNSLRLRKLEI